MLLEGLEVAFIVITFGSAQGSIPLAAAGAVAAALIVVVAGAVARGPLSRVPENTLAFGVGVMLTTFGIFWGALKAQASTGPAVTLRFRASLRSCSSCRSASSRRCVGGGWRPREALRVVLVGLPRR